MAEQFTLFPIATEKAGKRSRLRELMDAIEIHGPLLPQYMIAAGLDVSRQRVFQLVEAGRLATVPVLGRDMVPVASLEAYLADERRSGRPVADPTVRGLWKRIRLEQKENEKTA